MLLCSWILFIAMSSTHPEICYICPNHQTIQQMSYSFTELEKAIQTNHKARQGFIQTILTLASAMLAILAAIHSNDSNQHSITLTILFVGTVIFLAICILAGGITLYYDTVAAKTIYLQVKELVFRQLKNSADNKGVAFYNPPRLFYLCEKVCYLFALLSVLLLATYTVLLAILFI